MDRVMFVKVVCKKCGAKNVLLSRAVTRVKCPECGETQTVSRGGKAKITNYVKEEVLI